MEEDYGFHKLEVGQKIRVFKNNYNGKNFYKFQITQKHYDKTEDKFYINLQFKKGVELDNETDIVVHQFMENCRPNPKDNYNPIHYYQINGFEIVERQEQIEQQAYAEFQQNLNENEQLINESDLPF